MTRVNHPAEREAPRFFSYEEANRTLPLVRRIVEDIVGVYGAGGALSPDRASDLKGLIDELQQLGCACKGVREGLVDWYSYYAGRPVFLCWKLGEPEIQWWHQLDAGYVGRQRILADQKDAFRATAP